MAFMVPQYTDEPFAELENEHGETSLVPEACGQEEGETLVQVHKGKWFCRLSAPGYMDCTEWSGPFDTLQDARQHIENTYDVDPETGDTDRAFE